MCVKMPTNGIGMEGNKDDIDEFSRNQLQMCKRRRFADGFASYCPQQRGGSGTTVRDNYD